MCHRNRVLAAALLAALPLAGSAATLCVNPGGSNGCFPTIAGALAAAAPAGDTITVAAGTYNEGDLVVSKSVDVVGEGADVTIVDGAIAGNSVFRYLAAFVTSKLAHMTLQHGLRGVDVQGSNTVTLDHMHITQNGPWTGAGIANNSSILYVESSLIDYNHATDVGSVAGCDWGGASGGGLASVCGGGENHISNSTFAYNIAGRWGGGLLINGGPSTIENTTITGNQANFNGTGLAGSAIFIGGPPTTLRYVTIAGNSSAGAGGGAIWGNAATLYATLVQNNVNGDCMTGSQVVSAGYNLGSDASCPFTAVGDGMNVDAQLLTLADNGGDTPTMALPAPSPAVDRIPADQCAQARDQDGVARPQHGACDVGAFERVWTTQDLAALLMSQLTGAPETVPFANKFATILGLVLDGHPSLACNVLSNFSRQIENLAGHGKIPADRAAGIAQTVKDIEASVGC